ncbi:MAG: ABC transporter permease [Bdellovibrionales bacterium]|nr:ABC transporter permease [Bdellovibrionales bacterium]
MIEALLFSTLRLSTPMLFASLGGLFSERSGVINIALEGFMLVGAFVAAVVALATGSPWLGFAVAAGAGAIVGAFYAFFVVIGRTDQIVAGTAVNFLAMGAIPFALKLLHGSTTNSPTLPAAARFTFEPLILVWVFWIAAWWIVQRAPAGQWISFAGEHPQALATAGVSPRKVRFWSVVAGGALAAMGGACLSVFLSSAYSRNMTAGRGFMALAALIFGKWRPVPMALACLFFGFTDAVQIRLQGLLLPSGEPVPAALVQIVPFVVTVLVLAGFVGRARAPKALGRHFH